MNPTPDTALLDEVEALLAAATPGPWRAAELWHGGGSYATGPFHHGRDSKDDARLIAAAPTLLRSLAARVRELVAERDELATALANERAQGVFDLVAHLRRQRAFSEATFGPGARTAGVLDHIRKEIGEIERDPGDVTEWIDVVLLAFDGAWRAGHSPEVIAAALAAKQAKNEARTWPDWRTVEPGKAIEHIEETPPRLGCDCYPGCWRDHSEGWPEIACATEAEALEVWRRCHQTKTLGEVRADRFPWGTYVQVGASVRFSTEALRDRALRERTTDATLTPGGSNAS